MDGDQPENAGPGFIDEEILGYLRAGVPHAEIAVRVGTSIAEAKRRIERLERPVDAAPEARPSAAASEAPDHHQRARSVSLRLAVCALMVVAVGGAIVIFGPGSEGTADTFVGIARATPAAAGPAGAGAKADGTPYLRWPIEVYMAGGMSWHEPER